MRQRIAKNWRASTRGLRRNAYSSYVPVQIGPKLFTKTPMVQSTAIDQRTTTGGDQIQRTYFTVRSRKRLGSRTLNWMKKGLNPSAFASAARLRAARVCASSSRLRSADDCWSSWMPRSISWYSRMNDESTPDPGWRRLYSSAISAGVRVPSKSSMAPHSASLKV